MAAKVYDYRNHGIQNQYWFHCPGCRCDHAFTCGPRAMADGSDGWSFNGNLEAPTFTPSLRCNGHDPSRQCHSVVTDGKIKFYDDSYHSLKGQTVDLPDWEWLLNALEPYRY